MSDVPTESEMREVRKKISDHLSEDVLLRNIRSIEEIKERMVKNDYLFVEMHMDQAAKNLLNELSVILENFQEMQRLLRREQEGQSQ